MTQFGYFVEYLSQFFFIVQLVVRFVFFFLCHLPYAVFMHVYVFWIVIGKNKIDDKFSYFFPLFYSVSFVRLLFATLQNVGVKCIGKKSIVKIVSHFSSGFICQYNIHGDIDDDDERQKASVINCFGVLPACLPLSTFFDLLYCAM